MPRNIEIKVRVADIGALLPLLPGRPVETIDQDDTFFAVAHGRLKLRSFADGSAELIQYQRPGRAGARASDYVRAPVADAALLRLALERALGITGRVRKRRLLVLVGQTRVHLDRVEGLGDFVELEVVLHDGQSDADGTCIAETLLGELGLAAADRLAGAYLDLIVDIRRVSQGEVPLP